MRLSFVQEVLLAAAAGLALLLLVEAWFVLPEPSLAGTWTPVEASQSTAPSAEEVAIFALPPRDSLRAFVERPLFEKTRRSTVQAYAPKENAVEIADVALIGIVITSDERIAIMRARSGDHPVRVRAGDAIGDWRIVDITQNSVLLRNNETVQWVSLPGGG
jgi:hypothetical protein